MGVGEIVALSWLAALVARLKQRMPRVRYEIEVDLTVNMRQKLELGRLDLAIVAAPLDSRRLTETYVGSVAARWLIAPSLLVDAGPQPVDVAVLLQRHPVWCVARPSQMYPMVAQTLRSFGVPPDDINTSDNIQSIVELVANRAGIALVPDNLAAAHARDGRVVPLSDALPPQRLDFVVAMHRDENQGVLREIARCAAEVSPFERVAAG